MGSLERVQYKFASIIGELCSEPLTLSQFAVWLDLKLAEYKAKGSISLDCSGEKPEPPWMKGVLPSSPPSPPSSLFEHKNTEEEIHSPRHAFRNTAHSSQRQFPSSTSAEHSSSITSPSQTFSADELSERLAPDDVVLIKDEPLGGVFPTSVYHNETTTNTDNFSEFRKRPAASDTSSFSPHRTPFSTKVRRVANTSASASPSSASNQSVSGLVRESPSHDPTGSTSDDPVLVPISDSQRTDSMSQSSWLGQVTAERDADTSVSRCARPGEAASRFTPGGGGLVRLGGIEASGQTTRNIRKHNSTKRNMNAVVRAFERRLWVNSNDRRRLLDIPPEELDGYLADFFTTMKKPGGGDYNPLSFAVYRTSLEKYLKEHDYGTSLMSPVFTRSQQAFRIRKLQLEEVATRLAQQNSQLNKSALSQQAGQLNKSALSQQAGQLNKSALSQQASQLNKST